MNPQNKKKKKLFGFLDRSHSNPHLPESGPSEIETSSLPPSQHESRKGLPVPKFLRKVIKRRPASSAQKSPHPEPAAVGSSVQPVPPSQTTQDPSPPIAPAPEAAPDQASNLAIPKIYHQPEPPSDLKPVETALADAEAGFKDIARGSKSVQDAASVPNNLPSDPNTIDSLSAILGPLKAFNSIATELAALHPYATLALGIFTYASKIILDQVVRDDAVSSLLSKISEVYALLIKDDKLANIPSLLEIHEKIAQQTRVCADFIVHYSEMKNFWARAFKHKFDDTNATIQNYNNVLDNLMQQFRDHVVIDIAATVHRIAENLDLSGMECVARAGRNTSKKCLPGTREDILSDIQCWIRSTGEDVPRILWLSGTAGKGKSAIAHTIANWAHERGGMHACFCFDRTRGAERCHEKIFTTIARGLAACDPIMRGALARVVHDDNELKDTTDISRQWQELIVGPIGEASKAITAPVLITIDALDESGNAETREQILRLLASDPNTSSPQPSQLPENIRIIVTSRPLRDIADALKPASHVYHISMDEIALESAERDIESYISTMLKGPFNAEHFKILAQKSDGLFEWARLACKYISDRNTVGPDPMELFEAVVATTGKGIPLLDAMYKLILADSMPEDWRDTTLPIFRSVMGQIIASCEPLPVAALTEMRLHFPDERARYKVERVIGPLSSLLTATDSIRPLHASFYDFLTDESRSDDFFVDVPSIQSDLAFASLRIMERGLRFNICSLGSSYLPNSAVPDLEKRVKDSIPVELSYACRFWGTHVGAASLEPSLAQEIEGFFDGERLLWWLESMSLMKSLGGSGVGCLTSVSDWFTGHVDYTHIRDAARDTLRFVRTFASTILHSTPHLYLSALPFAPTQSRIFQKFATKFPRTLRIVAGHVAKWPQMEKILCGQSKVWSIAMSPDGKRIVCGSEDGTIQVWDMETGEALGAPPQGHTKCVASVAFSRDGTRIVSGSYDETVRVWDVASGKALGDPLRGHTSGVLSVAISPDGTRLVSGSWDETIRVWDVETGKALVLKGHTKSIQSVAISPDGKRIMSGSGDKTIRVWDMGTGEALGAPLHGHTDSVTSIAISPDGTHIISGSDDKTIRVWDMETGQALGAPLEGHTEGVFSVAISSDGNRILSGSDDQTIRVWNAETGEALGSPLQGHTSSVYSVAISPDGNHIVSGSWDRTIRVWDADTSTGDALGAALQVHTDSVNSVAISPDGHRIVSGSSDETVRVWDMETGEALGAPLQGHTHFVQSVAISPDGRRIVSGSGDTSIRMWDIGTGEALGPPLQGHTHWVRSIAISQDGRHIISGSDDHTIQVWEVQTGEVLGAPLEGHSNSVLSVAISPDGTRIVSGSGDGIIQVWEMGSGKATKALSAPLQGHTDGVYSVAISPDGLRIVSGSADKTVRMWDIQTGEPLGAALQGHTDKINSIAISSNGDRIVSGSDDMTIRVWDMETGEAVGAPIRGHTACIQSVAISPDGKYVVSGSDDKTIRVWDLEFLTQYQPLEAPAICFSSNPTHALHSASSFFEDFKTPAPSGPNEQGWVVGPEGRLLVCIPLNFHPVIHPPGSRLVIPYLNALQLDLSCLAHGASWHKCREPKAACSS